MGFDLSLNLCTLICQNKIRKEDNQTWMKSDEVLARQDAQRTENGPKMTFVSVIIINHCLSWKDSAPTIIKQWFNQQPDRNRVRQSWRWVYTDSNVFKNLENRLEKLLYKVLGSPGKGLFVFRPEAPVTTVVLTTHREKKVWSTGSAAHQATPFPRLPNQKTHENAHFSALEEFLL